MKLNCSQGSSEIVCGSVLRSPRGLSGGVRQASWRSVGMLLGALGLIWVLGRLLRWPLGGLARFSIGFVLF